MGFCIKCFGGICLWIYPKFLISLNIKYLQQQWRVNDCSHMLPIIHSAYHLFFFPFFFSPFFPQIFSCSTSLMFPRIRFSASKTFMMGLDFGGKLLNWGHWIFRVKGKKKNLKRDLILLIEAHFFFFPFSSFKRFYDPTRASIQKLRYK